MGRTCCCWMVMDDGALSVKICWAALVVVNGLYLFYSGIGDVNGLFILSVIVRVYRMQEIPRIYTTQSTPHLHHPSHPISQRNPIPHSYPSSLVRFAISHSHTAVIIKLFPPSYERTLRLKSSKASRQVAYYFADLAYSSP